MPLTDIFKTKSKEKQTEKKRAGKEEKQPAAKPKDRPAALNKGKRKAGYLAGRILKSPHITEKAGDLSEENQYIFRVFNQANKTEIKKVIESLYGVEVIAVRIINTPSKKRRLGKIEGTRPGYKKALVRIKKGQKIEVMPR